MGCILGNTLPQVLLGLCERHRTFTWRNSVRDLSFSYSELLDITIPCRPANNVAFFITIIVKIPVVQILAILHAFLILSVELPAPFFKNTGLYRSLPLRVVLLLGQVLLDLLFYQVRHTVAVLTGA